MGTRYRVLIHRDAVPASRLGSLQTEISGMLEFLDRKLMSTFAPDSQFSLLNRQAPGQPMVVAAEMLTVLEAAAEITALSGGAFDITVKPLVDLWGFGADGTTRILPDQAGIDQALALTGSDKVELNAGAGTVTRTAPVTLDLSAIAKGFAVDELASLLESRDVGDYLVEISGEIRIRGSRPGATPWQVGIETPAPGAATLFQALQTGNRSLAIATSGNYRNYFMHDGMRYSHTIDPATGWPVNHNLAPVTVITGSAMRADAWATALTVLGPEAGMKLANELQLAAYFIVDGSTGFSAFHSEAFNRYL